MYWSHVYSLFAFIFPRILFLFTRVFHRTFIIVTRLSLTILFFPHLCSYLYFFLMCSYIFVSNFHFERYIVWIQVIFSNITKIPYVLVNEPEKFQMTCALGYSAPNIFKWLVQWYADVFVCQLEDVFDTIINFRETFVYIHGFFTLLIRLPQNLLVFIRFTVTRMCYIDALQFVLVQWRNSRLSCFVDLFCLNNLWFKYLGT